jgi:hypothetical protein
VDGSSRPRPLLQADLAGRNLAPSRTGVAGTALLAYVREWSDYGIRRAVSGKMDGSGGAPEKLIDSSNRTDVNPAYSPDGNRIAFRSSRQGPTEI